MNILANMFQLLTYPRSLSSAWLLMLNLGLIAVNTTCVFHRPDNFREKEYFNGIISMKTPSNWHSKPLQKFWMNDPRDTVFTALTGTRTSEARITARQQGYMKVEDLSTRTILDAYYRNKSYAKMLSLSIDSTQNKLKLQFLAENDNGNDLTFFYSVIIIKGRKWVHVEMSGPNNQSFRDTANQIATSVKITSH